MNDWIESIKLQAAAQVGSVGQPRHGVVTSVDPVAHAVKVTLQPEAVESGWIPDPSLAASGLKISCPSEIGTQVLVVPVEGDPEHPVVVGRLFDVVTAAPVSPATGAVVQPGEVGVFLKSGLYLHMTQDCLFLKGPVAIDGSVTVNGDVTAQGVSLQTHRHVDVQPGNGLSGQPQASNG